MAPLAKQGTYTGLFGWNLSSAAHELEEGHVVTQDSYDGTFFNDDGDGFLHETSWVCPGTTDTVNGKGTAGGHCLITDKDNDKVFGTWARSIAQRFWEGEELTLQMDSHTKFDERWDERLIAMREATPGERPVANGQHARLLVRRQGRGASRPGPRRADQPSQPLDRGYGLGPMG